MEKLGVEIFFAIFGHFFNFSVYCRGYGSAAKTNLQKILLCTEANIESIFFKKKVDSMVNVLADHKILNVFELFMVELLRVVQANSKGIIFGTVSNFFYRQINKH